jgi:hypothetical protein
MVKNAWLSTSSPAFHKSESSSVRQGYVEVVTGVEGMLWGVLLWHMLAVFTLGDAGIVNRCGEDTLWRITATHAV